MVVIKAPSVHKISSLLYHPFPLLQEKITLRRISLGCAAFPIYAVPGGHPHATNRQAAAPILPGCGGEIILNYKLFFGKRRDQPPGWSEI
jgi:hypothetical protein